MLTATLPRPSPISIHRTNTRDDALISPFLLDPTSITNLTPYTQHRYQAIWLHMPVMVRLVNTREQALHHVQYLSRLRHPNLEQFLGAVVDDRSEKAVITEFVKGQDLKQLLLRRCLNTSIAITIALDVARALVYIHATTKRPHGGVSTESVLFDSVRCRAVVLLSSSVRSRPPCAAPEARNADDVGMPADVYSLAALLMCMFHSIHQCEQHLSSHSITLLPTPLQHVVESALDVRQHVRPTIEQLCQALLHCQ